jgi:Flp pilus assembly protein TadB
MKTMTTTAINNNNC